MDQSAFAHLYNTENRWWYRSRSYVVGAALTRFVPNGIGAALDFGAGFGGMRAVIAQARTEVYAYEPNGDARAVAKTRGYRDVFSDEAAADARQYDLICLFDVLEHLEDDHAFLKRMQGVLNAQGTLAITVPALPLLWGPHDVWNHHYRRYTAHSLRALLEQEGYTITYMRYWNVFLTPAALLAKMLGRTGQESLTSPTLVDRLLYVLIVAETYFMRFVPVPFGISLITIARKK